MRESSPSTTNENAHGDTCSTLSLESQLVYMNLERDAVWSLIEQLSIPRQADIVNSVNLEDEMEKTLRDATLQKNMESFSSAGKFENKSWLVIISGRSKNFSFSFLRFGS